MLIGLHKNACGAHVACRRKKAASHNINYLAESQFENMTAENKGFMAYFVGETHYIQFRAQPSAVECTFGIFRGSLAAQLRKRRGRLGPGPAVEALFFCRIYSDLSVREVAGAQTHGTSLPCSAHIAHTFHYSSQMYIVNN